MSQDDGQETRNRESTIRPQANVRIAAPIDRLIVLYTANDKPEEESKW